jgi:REP element-mobilizing transposase RayT
VSCSVVNDNNNTCQFKYRGYGQCMQQQTLDLPAPRTWGGARRRAGRPPKGGKAGVPHARREFLRPTEPVHVTLRVARDVPNLRTRALYLAIREATFTVAKYERFRIVQLSIQHDHIHLIVEALDRAALASGMQRFQISAAHHINIAISRRGRVFADRYHAHILRTPREVRHALAYVLNNWRKHGEDRGRMWRIDPFSSGVSFTQWHELRDSHVAYKPPPGHRTLFVYFARTWLLRRGWLRHGAISTTERPG